MELLSVSESVFLNVGQGLKQRGLEGDKRDREQQ